MILLIADPSPLTNAVQHALESSGEMVKQGSPSEPDLFMAALNCRALAYLPEPNLLQTSFRCNPDRMREILRASNAPGVKLLIVVQPQGSSYDAEDSLLRSHGIPYVIVRCPGLIEEFSASMNLRSCPSLWIPRGQSLALSSAAKLEKTVVDALNLDEYQGRTVDCPTEILPLDQALQTAAALQGQKVRVHATSPFLSKLILAVFRLFGRKRPDLPALPLPV